MHKTGIHPCGTLLQVPFSDQELTQAFYLVRVYNSLRIPTTKYGGNLQVLKKNLKFNIEMHMMKNAIIPVDTILVLPVLILEYILYV